MEKKSQVRTQMTIRCPQKRTRHQESLRQRRIRPESLRTRRGKVPPPESIPTKTAPGIRRRRQGTSGQNATAGQTPGQSDAADASSGGGNGDQASSGQNGTPATPGQSQSSSMATAKPGGSTVTTTPEAEKISCTIEIRCDSLVKNKKQAQESIWKYIPDDGEILAKVTVQMERRGPRCTMYWRRRARRKGSPWTRNIRHYIKATILKE